MTIQTPSKNTDLISLKDLTSTGLKNQVALALPHHVSADRMLRTVLTEYNSNEKLQKCTKKSVLKCVIAASQLGLEFGMLGNAYLIPYKEECNLIIGYKGMIGLARRSGQVLGIRAHVVDEADEFKYTLGLYPTIHHVPAQTKTGNMTYVYAVAQLKNEGYHFEVLSKADIEKIVANLKHSNKIWTDHFDEMAKKTAIRRLFKYLPISSEQLSLAVALDERAEANVDAQIDDSIITIEEEHFNDDVNTEIPQSAADILAQQLA